ncbi:MAG TPA: FUSC family protein [Myxococcales bacterium]|nr:FUSC family protein [Myxococcales bacterium]
MILPAAPVLGAHVRKSLELAAVRPAFSLGLRAATATIGPLVLGEITGQPLFVWMALGGWLCAVVDPGGPHLLRARSMAGFAIAGSAVTALGTLASSLPGLGIALLFVTSIASSLARVRGDAAGTVGTTTLIQLCIALGSPAPASQSVPRCVAVLGGCALSAFLALVLWPVHAYRPARVGVAACYRDLAALARAIAELSGDRERAWSALLVQRPPRIRAQLESARIALGAVRRGRLAESARAQQLVVLFETADVLLGALIMAGEAVAAENSADSSWLPAAADTLQRIADAVELDQPPPEAALFDEKAPVHRESERARLRVLHTLQVAVRVAAALHSGAPHEDEVAPSEAAVPRTSLRATLAPDSALLRHAVRLAVTVCIGAAVAAVLGVVKASWITIAVVIVLQPDSGSTVRKAVQRVLGTVAGALAAAVLAPALRSPTLIGLVLFPLSALGLALRPVNYGLFTLLVTPVFLLMAEIVSGDWHLGRARIVNTLIGGGLALAAQLLWPSRERDQLPQRLAALFHRLREYVDQVLVDPRSEPAARRSFGLAAANADSSFQRHLGEVAEAPERVSTYLTLLTYARRFRNAIVMALHSPEVEALHEARPALDTALDELGAAARDLRPPAPLGALPDSGPAMTRIARQLGILHSSVERLADENRPRTS